MRLGHPSQGRTPIRIETSDRGISRALARKTGRIDHGIQDFRNRMLDPTDFMAALEGKDTPGPLIRRLDRQFACFPSGRPGLLRPWSPPSGMPL